MESAVKEPQDNENGIVLRIEGLVPLPPFDTLDSL